MGMSEASQNSQQPKFGRSKFKGLKKFDSKFDFISTKLV
jgi:hypothetical protein